MIMLFVRTNEQGAAAAARIGVIVRYGGRGPRLPANRVISLVLPSTAAYARTDPSRWSIATSRCAA